MEGAGYRIALAGGGTGGHIVPGLHLLSHLKRAGTAPESVVWFLTGRAVEEEVLGDVEAVLAPTVLERQPLALEPAGGGAPSSPRVLLRLMPETLRARAALRRSRARLLLCLGGYTSLPAALAARSAGVPLALLEINAVAGRATRALTPLAARVFHAWPSSAGRGPRHEVLGPPLDPAFLAEPADDEEAAGERARLGFDPARALLVVLGGSQGAGALNDFVRESAPAWVAAGVQVLHQVGPDRLDEGLAPGPGYLPVGYLRPVHRALRAATLVLCRGGASTLAEVGASGRAAVVVPYPHAPDGHQEHNAAQLGEGAVLAPQADLGQPVAERVAHLLGEGGREERLHRAAAAAAAVPRDGGARLAQRLLQLAKVETPD